MDVTADFLAAASIYHRRWLYSSVSCLKTLEEVIVDSINLDGLSTKAAEMGVISSEVKRSFDSLDSNVPRPRKIRYLLMHAYEQLELEPQTESDMVDEQLVLLVGSPFCSQRGVVCQTRREHKQLFKAKCKKLETTHKKLERLLQVLSSHGVPSAVLERVKMAGSASNSAGAGCEERYSQTLNFSEEHVAVLVEILASCSGKWREVRTSLNLPHSVEEGIEARLHMYSDKKCLSEVLHEWIVSGHEHAKAPTLENLKKALNSNTVGLGKLASRLNNDIVKHWICFNSLVPDPGSRKRKEFFPCGMEPLSKKVRIDTPSIEIVSQTLDTEVADEKTTLLEVQTVSTRGAAVCFQWVKDGCPLEDDEYYIGSSRRILCITASLFTEDTYKCEVRSTTSKSVPCDTLTLSKPAIVTVNLPHYKQVLVDMYLAQSKIHRDAWPPVGNRTYINLALVQQKELDKGDAYSCYTIQGDVDDVVCKKKSISYDTAFSRHKNGALILIEGRPGSGKTTLVHKVSQDWATGKPILKGTKLVFLISLRVLSAKAIVKLEDIMRELFYKNDDETAKSVLNIIRCTNGEGVCFILDGLDEYEKQDSVVFDLINKAYLQRSMVIVSSRPSATFASRQNAHAYIEVIGFLKTQIQEYILKYPFTGRGNPQSLLAYLDQHPNVLRMCYLPVHVAMISFLHDKIKGDLPSTECKMYEHFTNFTLRRKNGSLPPNSDVILMEICERAFKMTESHTQFFIDEEELSLSDTCSRVDDTSLGLITIDSTAGLYGYHHLYTFVHLTFQEFLAAYYIAKLGEQEQRDAISKYGHMNHMKVVWRFYCGLVSFKKDDPSFAKILELQCDDQLFHCQCAFESQQPATCKSVVLHNHSSLEFTATHPADFTCLGYVISNSTSPLQSLKVTDIFTGDQSSKLHACADVLKLCGQLKVLDVRSNQLSDEGVKCFIAGLRKCSNLSELHLTSNEIGDEGAKGLSDGLRLCSNLSVLCLDYNEIGDDGVKGLADGLNQCTNLSILYLNHNKIGDEGVKGLGAALMQFSNLSVFHLEYNEIGDEGAKVLGASLRQCSNLSVLWLDHNKISDEGAKSLGDGLRQCNSLSALSLCSNHIGAKGAKSLGDGVKQCSNLTQLCLDDNRIGDEGAKGLGDSLEECNNLSILYLCGNQIGDEGAKSLSAGLRQCRILSTLWLDNNQIGDEGAKGLCDGLVQCLSQSIIIHLSGNPISFEGAKDLHEYSNLNICGIL